MAKKFVIIFYFFIILAILILFILPERILSSSDLDSFQRLDLLIRFITIVGLISGGLIGYYKFFIHRENETALEIESSYTKREIENNLYFVNFTVILTNKGKVRITGKIRRPAFTETNPLYNQVDEYCGDLKIKKIDTSKKPKESIRWYPEIKEELIEIDFLQEYEYFEDKIKKRVTDFFIEPNEIYRQSIAVFLEQGIYAAKITFNGESAREHWTRILYIEI